MESDDDSGSLNNVSHISPIAKSLDGQYHISAQNNSIPSFDNLKNSFQTPNNESNRENSFISPFSPQYQSFQSSNISSNLLMRPLINESKPHPTLGQIAEQIHESAKASARAKLGNNHEYDSDDDDDMGQDNDDDEMDNQGAESTGRWTKQEHSLFLEALKKYGKEWKKVASMVKTRTVVQTRTHAQKYFQKLAKSINSDNSLNIDDVINGSGEKKHLSTTTSSSKKVKKEFIEPQSALSFTQEVSPPIKLPTQSPALKPAYYTFDPEYLAQNMRTPSLDTSMLPPVPNFTMPSPAACGKRKHAELKVAQMLTGSRMDVEGAQVLSSLKSEKSSGKILPTKLSIINPEDAFETELAEPGTPWESQIKALNYSNNHSNISELTETKQKSIFEKLYQLISVGDTDHLSQYLSEANENLENLLDNAKTSLESSLTGSLISQTSLETPSKTKPSLLLSNTLNFLSRNNLSLLIEVLQLDETNFSQNTIYDICKLLIDYGANIFWADQFGNNALHFSARFGYERVGKLLLSHGSPINSCNFDGDTASHISIKSKKLGFLSMLVNLGANLHIRNNAALSPLELASQLAETIEERHQIRNFLFGIEPRLRTLILFHEDFMCHSTRSLYDWEGPSRVASIINKLRNEEEFPLLEVEITNQFSKADVTLLGRVHSPEYLAFVNDLAKRVRSHEGISEDTVPFTPQVQKYLMRQSSEEIKNSEYSDTVFSSGTLDAARRAAGAVAHAVDRVLLGRNRNAFCAVRPPGHHSGYEGLLNDTDSCGFCIFNNIAAGALHALEEHNCERVAIIDLDIHHGNGTEDIVRRYPNSSRLFFFSLHLFDNESGNYKFYPGTGQADDYVHNIINVPLLPLWKDESFKPERKTRSSDKENDNLADPHDGKAISGREAYRQAIIQRLIPSLRAFNPNLILISAGFDAALGDVGNCRHQANSNPIHGMDLLPEDFNWVTSEILKIADICCNGKVVSVLEGGYGEYDDSKPKSYSTRSSKKDTLTGKENLLEIDDHAMESGMDREVLANAVKGHVKTLIDPNFPKVNGQNRRN